MFAAMIFAAAAQTAPAPPAARPCRAAQLTAVLEQTDGEFTGMSHNGGRLRLTNVSGTACSLAAMPKLEFYDRPSSAPLDIEPLDSFGTSDARVTLGPRASAAGVIRWANGNVFQGGSCTTVVGGGYVAGGDGKIVPFDVHDQFCGDASGPRFERKPFLPT